MYFNDNYFTLKEQERGMHYGWTFSYETNHAYVTEYYMSLEHIHEYTYKKGVTILNRYQALIDRREAQRQREEIEENCEYKFGRKRY